MTSTLYTESNPGGERERRKGCKGSLSGSVSCLCWGLCFTVANQGWESPQNLAPPEGAVWYPEVLLSALSAQTSAVLPPHHLRRSTSTAHPLGFTEMLAAEPEQISALHGQSPAADQTQPCPPSLQKQLHSSGACSGSAVSGKLRRFLSAFRAQGGAGQPGQLPPLANSEDIFPGAQMVPRASPQDRLNTTCAPCITEAVARPCSCSTG